MPRITTTTRPLPLLAALVLLIGAAPGCRQSAPPRAEQVILERQIEALERLQEIGRRGPLVPFEQGLFVVDQSLLQKLVVAATPYETVVNDQFRVRITDGTVRCEDGLALVRLNGRASLAGQPEENAFVEATVWGALEEFALDADASVLRGHIKVIAFETPRAQLLGGPSEAIKGLMHDLARMRIEAFGAVGYSFDVPVRLVRDITLPELGPDGGVHVAETRIPLGVSVTDVKALGGKLWVAFDLLGETPSRGGGRVEVEDPKEIRP